MSELVETPVAATSEAGAITDTTIVAPPPADNSSAAVPDSGAIPAQEVKPEEIKPVVYELKLSEGSRLSQEHVAEIETLAKSKGLTNEQAQEMLAREDSLVKSHHDRQLAEHEATVESWREAAAKDKEIGGANLTQNAEFARRALGGFDTSGELGKLLEVSGFGNHPEVIRVLSKVGRQMQADPLVKGQTGLAPVAKRPQDILYNADKARK